VAKKKKKEGRLKWRTIIIPFSTVQFWVSFLVVLLVVATVLTLLYYQFLSPKAQARRLITSVEKQLEQAIVLGIKELSFDEYTSAQETLFEARKTYDERKYPESQILAEQSLASLEKALERLRSDEFFRRERNASISHVKGTVEVNVEGSLDWHPVRKGEKLKKGDKIRTRSGSNCVVQFDDGSQLTIKSDSLVSIDDLSEDIRTRTKNSAIKLLVSDVEASILRPTAKGSRFLIETPGSVAQVRKARVNIRVNDKEETEFKLLSGDVTVKAGNREVVLGQSEVVRLGLGGKVLSKGRLLKVPLLRQPDNLEWRVTRSEKVPVDFAWERVSGAASYHLMVATDRYFANVLYDNRKLSRSGVRLADLKPGLYYWKVSSVDSRGRESLFSSFRVFRVARDQTPPHFSINDPIVFSDANGRRVYISGAMEPGSRLSLDGRPVPIAPDGVFRSFQRIGPNKRSIGLEARDTAGNSLSRIVEVQ
jgi:ferric-dicitrate binding protein FerR (iron transport regulator)